MGGRFVRLNTMIPEVPDYTFYRHDLYIANPSDPPRRRHHNWNSGKPIWVSFLYRYTLCIAMDCIDMFDETHRYTFITDTCTLIFFYFSGKADIEAGIIRIDIMLLHLQFRMRPPSSSVILARFSGGNFLLHLFQMFLLEEDRSRLSPFSSKTIFLCFNSLSRVSFNSITKS